MIGSTYLHGQAHSKISWNFVSSETCILTFSNFVRYHRPHTLSKPHNIYIKTCASAGNGVLVLMFPIRVTVAKLFAINGPIQRQWKEHGNTKLPYLNYFEQAVACWNRSAPESCTSGSGWSRDPRTHGDPCMEIPQSKSMDRKVQNLSHWHVRFSISNHSI